MNKAAREPLCKIIREYGSSVVDDPRRCEALLRDLCADYRTETNVLLTALKAGVATNILHASNSNSLEALLARLSNQLQRNHGLQEACARWAVDSWALALGHRINEERRTNGVKRRPFLAMVSILVLTVIFIYLGYLAGNRFRPSVLRIVKDLIPALFVWILGLIATILTGRRLWRGYWRNPNIDTTRVTD